MNHKYKSGRGIAVLCFAVMFLPTRLLAQGPPAPSELEHPIAIVLLVVILGLLLAIGLLANVVLGAAGLYKEKMKKEKAAGKVGIATSLILLAMLLPGMGYAQEELVPIAVAASAVSGLSDFTFYSMISIIVLELGVMVALLYNLRFLMGLQKERKESVVLPEAQQKTQKSWFERWNRFVDKDKEETIDLGHEYDGIRELDNRLPPWWLYGFYISIIFAVVYLWRFHVSESGPSSAQEFQMAMARAEVEKEAYLKKAANQVDESNVEMLNDPSQLAAGKTVYIANCVACHGRDGEGGVGPNLTDEYWLHGGGIRDVFKTIKYGVPEKGMKSWKDDFSPSQIAQLSSYIRTLRGTNPANGKEKQGELYEEAHGN